MKNVNVIVPSLKTFKDRLGDRDDRNATMIKALYLTASRCNELLTRVSPSDAKNTSALGNLVTYSLEKVPIASLNNSIESVLLLRIPVLKRGKKNKKESEGQNQVFKMIALPCMTEYEGWTRALLVWLRDRDERLSFDLTRQSAHRIVKKELGIHPRLLRHYRLTHLVVNYGFGATDITQVAGWSLRTGFGAIGEAASPNVDRYLHLQWKQYIDKLFIPFKKLVSHEEMASLKKK